MLRFLFFCHSFCFFCLYLSFFLFHSSRFSTSFLDLTFFVFPLLRLLPTPFLLFLVLLPVLFSFASFVCLYSLLLLFLPSDFFFSYFSHFTRSLISPSFFFLTTFLFFLSHCSLHFSLFFYLFIFVLISLGFCFFAFYSSVCVSHLFIIIFTSVHL